MFMVIFINKKRATTMSLFTYECNEQSTAELQKLSVFHTTVTYATAKLHILFEMDNQNTEKNGIIPLPVAAFTYRQDGCQSTD